MKKNVNQIVELNDAALDQVNGGFLLEAATVGAIVFGTAVVGAYVFKIVREYKLCKEWAKEKKQRREQKAAAAA